jgi:hypothetical protein
MSMLSMLNVVLIIVGIFVAVLLIVLFIDAFGMEDGEKIKTY